MNVRFAGFGGQGIVMAGYVLGHAGVLDGRNAMQTQAYGSEARGGTCKSDVVISQDEIVELAVGELDVLVAMSQPALARFLPSLKAGGILIYDSDLVKPDDGDLAKPGRRGPRCLGVPATAIAHNTYGRDIVANAIVLGFLVAVTDVVSRAALRRAIAESVPPKTLETNLAALDEGVRRGVKSEA